MLIIIRCWLSVVGCCAAFIFLYILLFGCLLFDSWLLLLVARWCSLLLFVSCLLADVWYVYYVV